MFVEDNNINIGGTNVLREWGKVVDVTIYFSILPAKK